MMGFGRLASLVLIVSFAAHVTSVWEADYHSRTRYHLYPMHWCFFSAPDSEVRVAPSKVPRRALSKSEKYDQYCTCPRRHDRL